jgi:hypothetical protein
MDYSKVLATLAGLEAKGKTILADDRWKSSRLWAIIASVVLVILLHHFGIDRIILEMVWSSGLAFLVLRTLDDMNRDRCNAQIEVARIKAGFDDGAPSSTVIPNKPTAPPVIQVK